MNYQFSFESKFTASFFVVVSLLFASLFPLLSSAQTSVSGHILSSTGSPIDEANIYSHAYELGATSDSLGYFVIEGFPKNPASKQDVPPTDMTNSEFFISNVESVEG